MSQALRERGHEVRVVAYHLSEGPAPSGVVVHRTPEASTYHRLEAGPSVRKLLQMDPLLVRTLHGVLDRHPVDIVHAHHVEGFAAGWLTRRTGVPVVYDAHTLLESELPHFVPVARAPARMLGRGLDRATATRAHHVVTVTPAIRGAFVDGHGLPPARVSTVPNGVEWRRFDRPRSQHDPPVVLFAGGLTAYQGVDALLRAMREVRAARPAARLLLAVRDPDAFAPWRGLLDELGLTDTVDVRRAGLDDLPALLSTAAVAVNPRPRADGQPLKLLNYMSAGVPIVSCRGSSHGLTHGETAWLVDDDDPAALAEGIRLLLDEPDRAARLGRAARQTVRALPGWEDVAVMLEGVYATSRAAVEAAS